MVNIKARLGSSLGIFFIYMLASALVIMGFRLIFPGEEAPLAHFSLSWRLIGGFLEYLSLFPALALSSLVIPFGFNIPTPEKSTPFSPQFLRSLTMPIFTVIVASAIYGLLFSLVLPLARDRETDLRFKSRLYLLARDRANEYAAMGEWDETTQFIEICESIWPNGEDLAKLKIEAEVRIGEARFSPEEDPNAGTEAVSGYRPVNATEALEMAETALAEERYFDALWLADLGGRLAREDSLEKTLAVRLAGMAWSGVNSLEPNDRETRAYTIYRLKRDGHVALLGDEWIRAYYIFLELKELSPDDPDVAKYFALSENGLRQVAFFIDEIELNLGRMLTGAVFSLPLNAQGERLVMRIASLSTFPDSAYGIETEIMAFNRDGRHLWSMDAPYSKILPLTLDSGPAVAILLRALDRMDKTKQWPPVFTAREASVPSTLHGVSPGGAEIVLRISWENFVLLSNARRGLAGLSPTELKRASENLGDFGCLPQVFEAELLQRFVRPLLLLPLGILTIVLGWRYRALKRPRYMAIPMLGILPVVFNGVIYFSRSWVDNLGIWAVVSAGFASAAVFFAIGMVVLLFLSLIILAAQHG